MKIRKAGTEDLGQLVELSHQLYLQQINVCQADVSLRKDFKTLQKKAMSMDMKKRKNAFFVAVAPQNAHGKGQKRPIEEVVGFISGCIQEGPPVEVERKKGQVWALYVKEEFRGKGLGKKLFAEIKEWFRKKKIKTIGIGVARCNVGAKRMYESLGFEPAKIEQLTLKT